VRRECCYLSGPLTRLACMQYCIVYNNCNNDGLVMFVLRMQLYYIHVLYGL